MFSLVKVWLEMRNHLENSFVWLVLYFYMHVYTINSNCRLLSALSECRHILSRTVTSVVLGHISSQVLRSVCSFMINLIVGIFPRECCPLKEESVLGSRFLHLACWVVIFHSHASFSQEMKCVWRNLLENNWEGCCA